MWQRATSLTTFGLISLIGLGLAGCGSPAEHTTALAGLTEAELAETIDRFGQAESSQDVSPAHRAAGQQLTLITRLLPDRWYYAVLFYRSGVQRVVPVALQGDRAVVTVSGYPGEATLGPLTKVKVYSRSAKDIGYDRPPYRYPPLSAAPSRSLVLIHGYLGNELSMAKLRQALRGLYDHVFVYAYQYNDSITANSRRLIGWLADLAISGPGKRLDIVAHSLGGLVAREAIENHGLATNVDNLVTLGTPHRGDSWAATPAVAPLGSLLLDQSNWAHANFFVALYQYFFNAVGHLTVLADLNPASPFLERLSRPSHTSCTYLTIAGELPEWGGDLVVTPANANWAGLANEAAIHEAYTLPLGHSQLHNHPLACQTVKELLAAHRH